MRFYKERNKKLLIFFGVFIAFYAFYVLFDFPSFLFPIEDQYKDFATINYAMKDMNPYISWLSNYPPLILAISVIFTRMNDWHAYEPVTLQYAFLDPAYMRSFMILVISYIVLLVVSCVLYGILENKRQKGITMADKAINILIAVVLAGTFVVSAPSRFMIDRGNYLVVTVIFMVLWAVFEEMKPDSSIGAVFAALAAATKVYPVYLLGTYLTEKKWKKLITAIAVGIVVTIVPVFFFDGPFLTNMIEFAKGVAGFGDGSGVYSVYYTVGVTGLTGVLFIMMSIIPRGSVTKLLWLFSGGTFTILGFGFLRKEEKTWKKLLLVTSLMVFLSPNSYLYNSCYLFAPILLMLMNNDKLKKLDIPYYVMTALLMVPKAYFYFPEWGPGVPNEYNHVNIGVFLDGMLYLGIILYYLVIELIKYTKHIKGIREEDKVKVTLSPKALKACKIATIVAAILFGVYILYLFKDTVLGSHDSIEDFIDARLNPFTKGFTQCFKYGLARGRVGLIFPCVVAFRYLINGTGNYFLIWLLQYVPVYANIALIAYIVGKKVHKIYGFAFAICFLGLLQVDIWHSLITCYPLDFMYGLFIMNLGLYEFHTYLENIDKKSKRNIIRLIVSLVLFYESMQVYEAFIASSLLYAIVTLYYVFGNAKGFKNKLVLFVKKILPHFIVALVYIGILAYLRANPVVDVPVSEFGNEFNFKRFIITYVVLSFGMFPLFDLRIVHGILSVISKRGVILAFFGAIGFIGAFTFAGYHYSSLEKESRKRINRVLGIMAAMGVVFALTFAIPHSLLPVYENWVVDNATGGYVPTTICYFGWSVAVFSGVMLLGHYFSRIENKKRIAATLLLAFVFAGSVYATSVINAAFRGTIASTGTWMSNKAQGIWMMLNSSEFRTTAPDLIYATNMNGIHDSIEVNDGLFDHELGYNTYLTNDYDDFMAAYDQASNGVTFGYDDDAGVCFVNDIDNVSEDFGEATSSTTFYALTTESGTFEVVFYRVTDVGVVRDYETIEIKANTVTAIEFESPVRIGSIDFTRE